MNVLSTSSLFTVFAVGLATVGIARAQLSPEAVAPARQDQRIPVHTHATEAGEAPYGIWAAGDAYKVNFDGGMVFVPMLGRDYAHNQPFAWRTTAVRVGEQTLLVDAHRTAPQWTDYRVEYDLGDVVETYDVRGEGLEQIFVLKQRPRTTGELCIVGAVTSGLWAPTVTRLCGDLVFCDDAGVPIVRYGRAVAIDADGDEFPMSTDWDGVSITLRLSAEALAAADFPLVVDPLLSNQLLAAGSSAVAAGLTDVASELVNGTRNTAFASIRHYSAVDGDVSAWLGTVSLEFTGVVFADLSASGSADCPSLGYVSQTNRWVLAYQNLVIQSQQMQVRCATFLSGLLSGPSSTSIPHLVLVGKHEWRPRVGGVVSPTGGAKALVVWQQESTVGSFANMPNSEVHGSLFDTTSAAGNWTASFLVHGGGSDDVERPSVNRAASGVGAFAWLVVCQTYNNIIAGDDWDLAGRQVNNLGTVSTGVWGSSLGTMHKLGPVVDGRDGRYCVAFSTTDTSIGKNTDVVGKTIQCERLEWVDGDQLPSAASNLPAEQLASNTYRILESTSIAFNGNTRSHWVIAWRSSSTSPAAYVTRVGYRGKPVQSAELVATSGASIVGWPAVYHHDTLVQTGIVYASCDTAVAVNGRRFDLPVPPAVTFGGSSCSNATLQWNGPATSGNENQRIGSGLTSLRSFSAPANSLHLMLVALASVDVPFSHPILGSNCSLLVPPSGADYLGMMPLAVGADASWPLPLAEALPAMTLHFQDWILDPGDNLLYGTRRLSVPLVK